MGIFENLGRKVESFKQEATDSAEEPTHVCTDCEETFFADYEECPSCGSETVVPIE